MEEVALPRADVRCRDEEGNAGLCEFERAHVLDHQATHKGVVVEAHPAARQVPGGTKRLMRIEPLAAEA